MKTLVLAARAATFPHPEAVEARPTFSSARVQVAGGHDKVDAGNQDRDPAQTFEDEVLGAPAGFSVESPVGGNVFTSRASRCVEAAESIHRQGGRRTQVRPGAGIWL